MDISPDTKLVGLIGHPVEHSFSPKLHNSIYSMLGLNMVYLAFDVIEQELSYAVRGLRALGFIGFNVTIPYKEKILPLLDQIDSNAEAIGAVNTVKIEGDKLIGYNTDGAGFLDSLTRRGIHCNNKNIVILGAGGAARAIGIYLAGENPSQMFINNRTSSRAEHLAKDINRFAGRQMCQTISSIPRDVDIIINTTPIGMWPNTHGNPLQGYSLKSDTIVCDIVYNPPMTEMLKYAQDAGCTIIGGKDMLIGQGVRAIEIWTGKTLEEPEIWNII